MATINTEVAEVRSALKHSVTIGVRSVTQIVGGFLSLFLLSKQLSALMVVLIPSIILVSFLLDLLILW